MSRVARGLDAAARVVNAGRDVARVFRADASERVALDHAAHQAALGQFKAEFDGPATGFDRFCDGLNRLPRPLMAFGTLAMFGYAMVAPRAFAARMEGLDYVPEPLWWLLGAIVGFYFGARELHYRRFPRHAPPPPPVNSAWHHSDARAADLAAPAAPAPAPDAAAAAVSPSDPASPGATLSAWHAEDG